MKRKALLAFLMASCLSCKEAPGAYYQIEQWMPGSARMTE